MDLADYLRAHNITLEAFGADTDLSPSFVSRLARREKWPSRETAERIAEVTKGAVMPNDFLRLADEDAA